MLLFWALVAKITLLFIGSGGVLNEVLITMSVIGIFINLVLIVVNLVPVPPLDGGRVLSGLVSDEISRILRKLSPMEYLLYLV